MTAKLSKEELEDSYKKKLFIETIKNGKTPKRSGLGRRLYALAGFLNDISCTVEQLTFCTENNNQTKVLLYPRRKHSIFDYNTNVYNYENNLKSPEMIKCFEKYLKDFRIVTTSVWIKVFFDPNQTEPWSVMDADLYAMHPKRCRVDKRGFVYFKTEYQRR